MNKLINRHARLILDLIYFSDNRCWTIQLNRTEDTTATLAHTSRLVINLGNKIGMVSCGMMNYNDVASFNLLERFLIWYGAAKIVKKYKASRSEAINTKIETALTNYTAIED